MQATPDFLNLTIGAREHFDNIAQRVAHSGGSIVFKEGGPAEGIYVVCTGQVKLFATSSDGHTMILKIARLGDVLGLSAALNGLPYEVTAKTLSPCNFKHIGQRPFLGFLEAYAEAGYTAALILAREHREMVLGARRLVLSPTAASRIAQILIEFADSEGKRKPASSFPMVLTHAELASLVGASRETVTRLLNQFERDGIISRLDSTFTILRRSQLERLAN
jgi:CRP/FNR family transcriptional regulator